MPKLHKELAGFLETLDFGTCLRHPLVFAVPYFEEINDHYNLQYEHKIKAVSNALENKKFDSFIFLHERPFRLQAFIEIMDKLTDREYWELLRSVWTDCENPHINQDVWIKLFDAARSDRHYLMSEEEQYFFSNLPDTFYVYRGVDGYDGVYGISWTLDEDKANWFAKRFGSKNPIVACSRVKDKNKVYAYFTSRNESEIIINPSCLAGVSHRIS